LQSDIDTPPPHRVWIVDDSALEAELARRALCDRYATTVFTDGGAMLEALAQREAPDALVLDWQMPGISGIEICQFLRRTPATQELPVVLLTGHQHTESIVEGLSAGANDYVTKPFAPAELQARIEAMVRSRDFRARAERAEATVRALLEQLPDAVVATDANGLLVFANARFEQIVGGGRNGLIGRPITDVLPALVLDELLSSGSELPPANDLRVGDAIYSPAVSRVDLSDSDCGLVITLRNVTEKRRAEHRRLDFYSIIAHDLRSPLTAISIRAHLLRSGQRGPLSPAVLEDLRKMNTRIDDLVALINDFLDLARLEGVGLKLDAEAFDMADLVTAVIDDFRSTAESSALTLTLAPPPADTRVPGDRRRVTQVVTNLVANALKFTPAGGRIDVAIAEIDGNVEVAVSDTGVGIAPAAVANLFQRYARAQSASGVAGTGLGLLIVREIVEAHGGRVGVRSQPGVGSTFWFRLPRRPIPEVLA
jgi:signal transduction histidine kinase